MLSAPSRRNSLPSVQTALGRLIVAGEVAEGARVVVDAGDAGIEMRVEE